MSLGKRLSSIFTRFILKTFAVKGVKKITVESPKRILIVRQHNQFGDLLATVPLFKAIKKKFKDAELTLIVSPQNFYAVTKNKYIDKSFVFDKQRLFNPFYFIKLLKVLRKEYDVVVVPVTVAVSATSCLLARFSNAKLRVGPKSLDGRRNLFSSLFHIKVGLDWRKNPDSHVAEFGMKILYPLGVFSTDYVSVISFDKDDMDAANQFLKSAGYKKGMLLVGLHVGAGKPPNRWPLDKYISVIKKLHNKYSVKFYITGSKSDKIELDYIKEKLDIDVSYFIDRTIPELSALISKSDLFITNDTGVMHVAGTTKTPQISIFGPTNPFNWAPVGKNKIFLKKTDLINDISVNDVMKTVDSLLIKNKVFDAASK